MGRGFIRDLGLDDGGVGRFVLSWHGTLFASDLWRRWLWEVYFWLLAGYRYLGVSS